MEFIIIFCIKTDSFITKPISSSFPQPSLSFSTITPPTTPGLPPPLAHKNHSHRLSSLSTSPPSYFTHLYNYCRTIHPFFSSPPTPPALSPLSHQILELAKGGHSKVNVGVKQKVVCGMEVFNVLEKKISHSIG